ncbi:MAG: membrane associated rhomboid family serine protease [Candidatus Nanohaloarchaea archaeon]|jgi:membrane associated rhomboid family serine protease
METENFNFTALKLCGVFAGVFALQIFTSFDPAFSASSSPWWKFFTSFFGHGDLEHLMNNLFFIGLFGSIYERFTSSRIFLATFLVSAVFANLSAFIFFAETSIIGASGGGMGLMAALAVFKPRKIGLAMGVPAPMWLVLAIYVLINVAGLSAVTGTAYEAHLMGLLSGGLIGLQLRELESDRKHSGKKKSGVRKQEKAEDDWSKRIREWEEKWMMK